MYNGEATAEQAMPEILAGVNNIISLWQLS
jgi:hypothetical protein